MNSIENLRGVWTTTLLVHEQRGDRGEDLISASSFHAALT